MSRYERTCACCKSELCDQDDWCLNSDDEPVCEACVLCSVGEGLLYLADVETPIRGFFSVIEKEDRKARKAGMIERTRELEKAE